MALSTCRLKEDHPGGISTWGERRMPSSRTTFHWDAGSGSTALNHAKEGSKRSSWSRMHKGHPEMHEDLRLATPLNQVGPGFCAERSTTTISTIISPAPDGLQGTSLVVHCRFDSGRDVGNDLPRRSIAGISGSTSMALCGQRPGRVGGACCRR